MTIRLTALLDHAWSNGHDLFGFKPNEFNGYIAFRNKIYKYAKETGLMKQS